MLESKFRMFNEQNPLSVSNTDYEIIYFYAHDNFI